MKAVARFAPLREDSIRSVFGFLIIALALFWGAVANAASILDIEDSPVAADLTLEQVQDRIIRAGAVRGWRMKATAPGQLKALIRVRTHAATILIDFDTKSYSISYHGSSNLNHSSGEIHSNYNQWIRGLKEDIDAEFGF